MSREQIQAFTDRSPLLPSHRAHLSTLQASEDWIHEHIITIHGDDTWVLRLRTQLQRFMSSKWGHYFVILLTLLDIVCIVASFLISLHVCENGSKLGDRKHNWLEAKAVLAILSLIVSCLFMAELLGTLFSFGFSYFSSPFHVLDAAVIIAAFVVECVVQGHQNSAASLVIALRLWRVVEIIEEFSSDAELQREILQATVKQLTRENERLRAELEGLKVGGQNGHASH